MRAFYQISSLALLLSLVPYLTQAKVYKIEDYNRDGNKYNSNNIQRISCDSYPWDYETCTNNGGIMPEVVRCGGRSYSNDCLCGEGYVRSDNDPTQNEHFNFNRPVISMQNRQQKNGSEISFYCVPEPHACEDTNYVLFSDVNSLTSPSFSPQLSQESLNIFKEIGGTRYKIATNDDVSIYSLRIGERDFYCAPNITRSYNLSTVDAPEQVDPDNNSLPYISLSNISNTSNTNIAQSEIAIGGLLSDLNLHYISGCAAGYSFYRNSGDLSCSNGGDLFPTNPHLITYINETHTETLSGYCAKCTGCANGFDDATNTLYGALEKNNETEEFIHNKPVHPEAFSAGTGDCSIQCSQGYVKIYAGPRDDTYSYELNGRTCNDGINACLGTGTVNRYTYSYSTITKSVSVGSDNESLPYILVCAQPIACNVSAGYIGACQSTCWKSFFSTQSDSE